MEKENLAALDLGTNSCRLTITDQNGNFLYRDSIATKLGEKLHQNKKFTPEAVQRGLSAFDVYAKIMQNYGVKNYRAIATASCRMAQNGAEFVRSVQEQTGIRLEIIDGVEEARLNLKGAAQNAPADAEYIVVYDLGGGSTEISLAKLQPELQIMHTVSIPWGGRNAAEAFDLTEYQPENADRLQNEIKKWVDEFVLKSELEKYRNKAALIATSSTPLRLVSMVNQCGIYEREKSDGVTVACRKIDDEIAKIYQMPLEQRIESTYIGENRAPIFVAACVIFKTIYDGLKFETMTASLKSAQDGIIEELKSHG